MNKILIPKNPDETIILPPYVDFREPEAPEPDQALRDAFSRHRKKYRGAHADLADEAKPSKQEGRK